MNADTIVPFLQKIPHLHVLEVRLEADVVVGGVRDLISADALAQHVALVAGGTSGAVFVGAGGAGSALAHGAGDDALTGRVLVGARTAPGLLQVRADVVVLAAVHYGQDVVEPVAEWSVKDTKGLGLCAVLSTIRFNNRLSAVFAHWAVSTGL